MALGYLQAQSAVIAGNSSVCGKRECQFHPPMMAGQQLPRPVGGCAASNSSTPSGDSSTGVGEWCSQCRHQPAVAAQRHSRHVGRSRAAQECSHGAELVGLSIPTCGNLTG
jgi:hypothetical protein